MGLNVLAYSNIPQRKLTIYVMKGCGACEAFKPIVHKVAAELERLGWCLPFIEIVDVDDKSREAEMNAFRVQYTPTMVYQRQGGYWRKWEQGMNEAQLAALLQRVSKGSCAVE